MEWYLEQIEHFLWKYLHVNATEPHWWYVNISSVNGLLPDDSNDSNV